MSGRKIIFAAALLFPLALTGCRTPLTSTTYERREARRTQAVHFGTVLGVSEVTIAGEPGAVGTVAGAAAGAAVGQSVGGGRGRQAATIIGGAAGAVAGGAVEQKVTTRPGVEITLKMDDGSTIAVVQEKDPAESFAEGDYVRVLRMADGTTRVRQP